MSKLTLPRIDDDGKHYISYSQIKSWHAKEGYNTKMLGRLEYIREYFFGEDFPDAGYGQFGTEVEDYICERNGAEKFTDAEKKVMESITPYGTFQKEIKMDFGWFYVKGFIDDCDKLMKRLRDFKTASQSSKQQYFEDTYKQLDIYALAVLMMTGNLPEKLEVTIIGRKGNTWGRGKMYVGELEGLKGRDALFVDDWVETIEKPVDEERIESVKQLIVSTAEEVAKYHAVFTKLQELKA